jgi:dienelactone hydrolase
MVLLAASVVAQEYGKPDRGQPGDEMIQAFLKREADRIHATFLEGVKTKEDFEKKRDGEVGEDGIRGWSWNDELRRMLSVPRHDPSAPLHTTVTGSRVYNGVIVENLHYQSLPKLYVTANLYRPEKLPSGEKLPAVLYVCGHSSRGRNGNKTAYQSHGLWFARHGYVCLVLDTLQMGEIEGIHHGTYREQRWWWHSAGYTPAGLECLNGMRGIDLLIARPDVDAKRIAVTGISGGGATTMWIAASDRRVACAVPVSGMADLPSYVGNRVINGHCDCMFPYNTYRWPWARIPAMIAPRPLLFVNSDADPIFPMDANDRLINRLERVYSLFGASDKVDAVVSIGGHAYREDIRKAVYRFINTHLKGDPREVEDSEVDLVTREGEEYRHPIPPVEMRAFATHHDIPEDQINTTIDRVLAAGGSRPDLSRYGYDDWRRFVHSDTYRAVRPPHAGEFLLGPRAVSSDGDRIWLESEKGVRFSIERVVGRTANSVLLVIVGPEDDETTLRAWEEGDIGSARQVWFCRPRGIGPTRWTQKNPPNYIERSHLLLGRTVDGGRVWDAVAAARYLLRTDGVERVEIAGSRSSAVIAACAALIEEDIAGAHLREVPASFLESGSPQLLGILRNADIPQVLGALAPRPLVIGGIEKEAATTVKAVFDAAKASDKLRITPLEKQF